VLGTRQEIGLVVLLVLLAVLGCVPGLFSTKIADGQPCRIGMEITGEVLHPGFVCMEVRSTSEEIVAQVGMPTSCRLERPRPGRLFKIHRDSEENCQIEDTPIPGSHVLLAGMLIDLNAARAVDLEAIPGVGAVLAQRIIAARDERGVFSHIEDLLSVKGIGTKRLTMLRHYLMVGERAESTIGAR
jgi:competence ComEA-like helix-hairpin-helix protein